LLRILKLKEAVHFFVCKFRIFQLTCPVCSSENIPSFEEDILSLVKSGEEAKKDAQKPKAEA